MFSCEFCETSKNTLFTEHLWTTDSDHALVSWSHLKIVYPNLMKFSYWYHVIRNVNIKSIISNDRMIYYDLCLFPTIEWLKNYLQYISGCKLWLHSTSLLTKDGPSQRWSEVFLGTDVFLGKGLLKICSKFIGEHPCRGAISIKLQSNMFSCSSKFTGEHPCRGATSIKLQSNFTEITLRHGHSPVNLLHISRTSFPKKTPGLPLLKRGIPGWTWYGKTRVASYELKA